LTVTVDRSLGCDIWHGIRNIPCGFLPKHEDRNVRLKRL
jgi:hypothetical protein